LIALLATRRENVMSDVTSILAAAYKSNTLSVGKSNRCQTYLDPACATLDK
jgi:hypothetical protein